MLTDAALKRDIARRIQRLQTMMHDNGVDALIIAGNGGPSGVGAIRYVCNAQLWGGAAYVVLGSEDPDPWAMIHSSYQAVWTRNETTTDRTRIESPKDIIGRTVQIAKQYATQHKRIGMVYMHSLVGFSDYQKFITALEGYELVNLTDAFNAIRQIKSPFELEALQENGIILDAAMDVFRENAYVGARYWNVCAAVEGFCKAKGAFWGRTKLSLDLTPYTVPPHRDQIMKEEDIINFEIVYESAWGYWLEMTTIFSFHPLPDSVQAMLDAYLLAAETSAAVAKSGAKMHEISEANDSTISALGFKVAGKHTPDCHSIGIDGSDGPSNLAAPDFELKSNMVLSFHPGTVLEDNRGFLISDNFLVTPEGAVRLSPHHARRYHLLLDR